MIETFDISFWEGSQMFEFQRGERDYFLIKIIFQNFIHFGTGRLPSLIKKNGLSLRKLSKYSLKEGIVSIYT